MSDPSPAPAALIAEGMARFRRDMEANDRLSLAIAGKTKRIILSLSAFVAIMMVAVIIQIMTMRSDLAAMVEIFQDMYLRFETISADLDVTTDQVRSIQGRVSDFPSVAADLTAINGDAKEMGLAIGGMTDDVSAMTSDTTLLRGTTAEMAHHFYVTQQTVSQMGYNVEQMLRPMKMMPR